MRELLRRLGPRAGISFGLIVVVATVVIVARLTGGGERPLPYQAGTDTTPTVAATVGDDAAVAPAPSTYADDAALRAAASTFTTAWLQRNLPAAEWLDGLRPLATQRLIDNLAGVDPLDVPVDRGCRPAGRPAAIRPVRPGAGPDRRRGCAAGDGEAGRPLARRHARPGPPVSEIVTDLVTARPARKAVRRALVIGSTAIALAILCVVGTALALLDGLLDDDTSTFALGCGNSHPVDPAGPMPAMAELTEEQVRIGAVIIKVGQDLKVPPRGWVIAVATALQESRLQNLPHLGPVNDHDSIGVFQQRPSQGWGTLEQLADPAYQSRKFYEKLLTVAGWQTMSLTRRGAACPGQRVPRCVRQTRAVGGEGGRCADRRCQPRGRRRTDTSLRGRLRHRGLGLDSARSGTYGLGFPDC